MVSVKCTDVFGKKWEFKDVEHIAFDKDGTLLTFDMFVPVMKKRAEILIERYNLPENCYAEILQLMGIDPKTEKVVIGGAIHTKRVEIIRQTSNYLRNYNRNVPIELISAIFDEVDNIVDFGSEVQTYPGVKELLEELKGAGVKLSIITHDTSEAAKKQLKSAGIDLMFDQIIGLDLDSHCSPKPAPDLLIYTTKLLEVEIKKTIVVGDDNRDMLMGKNAGALGTIGVLTGRAKQKDLSDADIILESVSDIKIKK